MLCHFQLKFFRKFFCIFCLRWKIFSLLLFDLKSNKEVQISNHTHLKVIFYHLSKLMCKWLHCTTKNDVIHINLGGGNTFYVFFNEMHLISSPSLVTLFYEIGNNPIIPCYTSSIQSIQDFLQHVNITYT